MSVATPASISEFTTSQRTSVRRSLLRWFAEARRDLPWRRTRDPYHVWVSEIMLQQTRVETVIPYFARFLQAFPNVATLAAVPESRVLKLWEGLGYYSRARNLQKAAQHVVADFAGRVPTDFATLQTLPGIGRYTAAAIASICANERVAVLDGNVKRVLARLFAIDEPIADRAVEARLWEIAESLVAPKSPGDHNEAMMELGATICLPKNPRCVSCPVQKCCGAFAAGRQDELPIRTKKATVPTVQWACVRIERAGKTIVTQRPNRGLFAGLWELPTVEDVARTKQRTALERLVGERLATPIAVGGRIGTVNHTLTHRQIELSVYDAAFVEPTVRLKRRVGVKCVSLPSAVAPMSVLMQKAVGLSR